MAEIDFTQPFSNLYEIDFTQSFANLYELDFTQPFINGFEFDFTQPFSNVRALDFTQPFTHAVDKSIDFEQPFSNFAGNPYSFDYEQPFGHINIIDFKQPFPMAADQAFNFDFTQPFSNQAGTTKTFDFEQPFVNLNPQFKSFYSTYGSNTLSVTLSSGKAIGIDAAQGVQISQEEGSPYWQCQFNPATIADYGLLTLNTAFTVNFYGTSYSFIVDTRPFRRSSGLRANEPQIQTGITGLSPLALLASPRAEQITKTWATDEKAKDIVEELIGSVTWNVTNWTIPANRFGVNNQSPMEAAQQIVQAVGGVIQSTPSGAVIVRSLYPVKVPSYESNIDTTLSDADISEISESIAAQQYYNRFEIRDSDSEDQSAGQDRLEFVADDALELSGTVRAFPNPWRTNLQLTTTRANVSIAVLNDGEEITGQITQEGVEVKEGRASVQYPIMQIVNVTYLTTNLGGVSFDGQEISTAIKEWSLINITYRYRYIGYQVTALTPIKAQFLLEET